MAKILLCGLLNLESTVNVRSFPVEYSPIEYPFNQVGVSVGGVGFNLAKALMVLGEDVTLLSYLSDDLAGKTIRLSLKESRIDDGRVLDGLNDTPTSVVLYDESGARKIYCDLKDAQEQSYPHSNIDWASYDLALLTNVNFARPLLGKAKAAGIPIATDVQALGDPDDAYNRDYMEAASILFLSNVCFEGNEEEFVRGLVSRYHNDIVGVGMGEKGALLYLAKEDSFHFFPAKTLRPVVSTVGAGDSLLASFLHVYLETKDPVFAMERAVLFAGYKIGSKGASEGFLTKKEFAKIG